MKLNHLQHALTALSERSQTSLDLLNAHLRAAEERAEAAGKLLEVIDARLARLLAASQPDQTAGGENPTLEAKLDLLERALDVARQGSKSPEPGNNA